MPVATVDDLMTQLKEAALKARAIADDAEKNRGGVFTDAERAEITEHLKSVAGFKSQIKLMKSDDSMKAALSGLGDLSADDLVTDTPEEVAAKMQAARGRFGAKMSIGQAFTQSPQFKAVQGQAVGGRYREKQKVDGEPVHLKSLVTGASDTSGGALIVNDNIGLISGLDQFQRPLNVKTMLTNGTTSVDAIDYVQITGTTNNAAIVAESTATATPGSPSPATGVKPESALTLAKKTANVRTFAHWIPATTRALSDAGQIRTLIDAFLVYGLAEELEDQIVNGDAAGESFDGITHVSGTQALDGASIGDVLGTIRRARTLVRVVGRSLATAYLMNPYDWEMLDLTVDGNGRYYFGGPSQLGTPNIWGLPVVESEAVEQGTVICADFRKAILWDREDSAITMSGSHLDFFTRNMVAILAEDRYGFAVIQPNAFVIADISSFE
jgi:HK97 family phage major capsid protein